MRRRSKARLAVFGALAVAVGTGTAEGQVTALHIVSRPAPADVLPGYVVNDLLIDFTGQYTGSQMTVEVTSGSIYQNENNGRTPPIEALIGADPTVEWDSFVANGGPTAETTIGDFRLDICIGICLPPIPMEGKFTDELIDQAWFPAGGNEILDQTGFMVARVTLSDNATGTFEYLGAADELIGVVGFPPDGVVRLPIRNGFIIPEPATIGLLVVRLAVAMAAWRCIRSRRPFA